MKSGIKYDAQQKTSKNTFIDCSASSSSGETKFALKLKDSFVSEVRSKDFDSICSLRGFTMESKKALLFDSTNAIFRALNGKEICSSNCVNELRIVKVRITRTAPSRKVVPVEGASKFAVQTAVGFVGKYEGASDEFPDARIYPDHTSAAKGVVDYSAVNMGSQWRPRIVGIEETAGEEIYTVEEI
jgi:hypothetical protein